MPDFLGGQFGFKLESVYGTPVTVNGFIPYKTQSLVAQPGRVVADSLKPTQYGPGDDRVAPYFKDGAGSITFHPSSKSSLAKFLSALFGTVTSTGPAETAVYTHSGTFGSTLGKSFTIQMGVPDNTGTVVPYTFAGCKLGGFSMSMSSEGALECTIDVAHAASYTTATGLATATYPASVEYFFWSECTVTVGGTTIPIVKWSVSAKQNLLRRQLINGTAIQLEATQNAMPTITFSMDAEHGQAGVLSRAAATSAAGIHGALIITCNAKTLLGTTLFPAVIATIAAARFDSPGSVAADPAGFPMVSASGVASQTGSTSPLTVAVQTADVTP